MSTYRVFSLRSYSHLAYLICNIISHESPELAPAISKKITYETTGTIWQLPSSHIYGHRGCIVERPYTYGDSVQIGVVGERLLVIPELVTSHP